MLVSSADARKLESVSNALAESPIVPATPAALTMTMRECLSGGHKLIGLVGVLVAAMWIAGCGPIPPRAAPLKFASAAEVEENFRGRSFVLGDNSAIALVRPVDWPGDKWLKLPFWLGINLMVPAALRPREGGYYVISEARLVEPLDTRGEWMIEAGSSLIKREALFVTVRTHYLGEGKILPTIVQFTGMRQFRRDEATVVHAPVLREVSLPMKWTLGGDVPASYAKFRVE